MPHPHTQRHPQRRPTPYPPGQAQLPGRVQVQEGSSSPPRRSGPGWISPEARRGCLPPGWGSQHVSVHGASEAPTGRCHQGENMGTHPGTPGGESQEGSAADRSLPCPRPQGTHGPRAPPWPPSCTCSAPPRRRVTESTHPWVWGAASSFPRHSGRPWGTQPAQGLGPAPYPSTQQLVGQHPH